MKTLLLIRHAKAERAGPHLADHDRALDDEGQGEAREMGRRLKQRGIVPDRIITSTALRAITTARLIADELGVGAEVLVEDGRIYASSPAKLLLVLQELDDGPACVALVGHNPEMTELAQHLAPRAPVMATGAVAQMDFELASWVRIDSVEPTRTSFQAPGAGADR
jgi:phosphohistidine phosphatase